MSRNPILPYDPKLKTLARNLRKNMTYSEVLLWQQLRDQQLGYQFHRQVPVKSYIMDFYCHELRLAIEIDGSSHRHPEVSIRDLNRQREIEELDISFLRFEEAEVQRDLQHILQTITDWIRINK